MSADPMFSVWAGGAVLSKVVERGVASGVVVGLVVATVGGGVVVGMLCKTQAVAKGSGVVEFRECGFVIGGWVQPGHVSGSCC